MGLERAMAPLEREFGEDFLEEMPFKLQPKYRKKDSYIFSIHVSLFFFLSLPSPQSLTCIFSFYFSCSFLSLSWGTTSPLTELTEPFHISRGHPNFLLLHNPALMWLLILA